ncbi:MAG: hypothetical protein ACRDG8_12885 [Actinomycetota bacterium]
MSDTPRPPGAGGPSEPRSDPVVELGPPVSDVPWSSEFVQQSLELLILTLDAGSVVWLKPMHADSLHVGLPVPGSPGNVVLETLGWYDLSPRVVHSTSWRHDGGRLVLTYVAVVDPPATLPADTLERAEIARRDLARGEATAPPTDIAVEQVIEHALRHLSWLVRDDTAIAEAIPEWVATLDHYQPEPFRALG